jgi:hypothetical protein
VVACSEPPDEAEGETGDDGVEKAAWDVDCNRVSKIAKIREGGVKEDAY